MHMYMITRGIKHDSDRFINELSAKYLPFNFKGKGMMTQVSVRPINLYEVVFPEEHLQTMIATLGGKGLNAQQHPRHKKFISIIRRCLGKCVKPIPEYDGKSPKIPVYMENVEINGIGIKEDYWRDNDDKRLEGKPQEGEGYEAL